MSINYLFPSYQYLVISLSFSKTISLKSTPMDILLRLPHCYCAKLCKKCVDACVYIMRILLNNTFPSAYGPREKGKWEVQLIANMKKSTAWVNFKLRSVLNQYIMCKIVDMVYTTSAMNIHWYRLTVYFLNDYSEFKIKSMIEI